MNEGRLRALIEWAERNGAPARLCAAASDEYLDLIDRPLDHRIAATLARARRIVALQAQGLKRADICARLGLRLRQYHHALAVYRDSRNTEARDFGAPTAIGAPECPDS